MKKLLSLIMATMLTLSLVSCSGEKTNEASSKEVSSEQTSSEEKVELKDVTVILDYLPNTNHTGLYVAKDLGYYEELGLNVEIVEPTEGATPALVATGKGQFGISYQEDLTYALTAKEPLAIKAIATIIQHNTSGFVTATKKEINTVNDFEGKVYAGWGAPSEEAVIKAVMSKAGADFDKLSIVTSDGSGIAGLQGQVDIGWEFYGWSVIQAQLAGIDVNYMPLAELDERLDYYTPIIISNTDTIENDPQLVEDFMTATKKGYEYSIENPTDSAKILNKAVPEYELEMLIKSQEYLSQEYSKDSDMWGVMKDEVWDNYTEFMVEYGLIEKAIDASECYTNEFLK